MRINKFLDPFSVPTQMNNLGVLVVAYVANRVHEENGCEDPGHEHFLYFILYGSTLVCGGTFILTILYILGIIDYCINKICPCGEVCLTLNTLGIFLLGFIYHCIATVYGIGELLVGYKSKCVELEMFKLIAGIIYAIWLVGMLLFLLFVAYRSRLREREGLRVRIINA